MRVLVTNDDGAEAIGIHHMARALARDSRFDVVLVAPDQDRSGTAASLGTIDADGLRANRVAFADDDRIEAWALAATPAMCVMAANLGAFGRPPDIVVSGVNAGLNTGRAVLYSGTVGAALSAQNLGLSALAVSLQSSDRWHWDTATALAMEAVDLLIRAPGRSVLNLNVPALDRAEVRGLYWARLAPFGEVRMVLTGADAEVDDHPTRRVATELQFAQVSFDPDTDTGLVRAGYASLTTLTGISEAWPGEAADPVLVVPSVIPGAPLDPTHEVPDADQPGNLHRPAGAS
ncbi:MAG: 5'/3'-nucleotidase SurE [Acidimicrobiia bacterium]|nr:5'/3'-nucleotidase SurE [Acidimicrobiia bacterium]